MTKYQQQILAFTYAADSTSPESKHQAPPQQQKNDGRTTAPSYTAASKSQQQQHMPPKKGMESHQITCSGTMLRNNEWIKEYFGDFGRKGRTAMRQRTGEVWIDTLDPSQILLIS